jgi:hypothetical protein
VRLVTASGLAIAFITIPGSEFLKAGHFNRIDMRVDRDLYYCRSAGSQSAFYRRCDVFAPFHEFPVSAIALGDLVEAHLLAPLGLGVGRIVPESRGVPLYVNPFSICLTLRPVMSDDCVLFSDIYLAVRWLKTTGIVTSGNAGSVSI